MQEEPGDAGSGERTKRRILRGLGREFFRRFGSRICPLRAGDVQETAAGCSGRSSHSPPEVGRNTTKPSFATIVNAARQASTVAGSGEVVKNPRTT